MDIAELVAIRHAVPYWTVYHVSDSDGFGECLARMCVILPGNKRVVLDSQWFRSNRAGVRQALAKAGFSRADRDKDDPSDVIEKWM